MISDVFMLPLDGLTLFKTKSGWQLSLRETGSSGWRIFLAETVAGCFEQLDIQSEEDPFA